MNIREKPPLRLTYEARTPGGRVYRWASDARDPRDKPSGATFSSTMPGGHAEFNVTLPRKSSDGDADLERLTTIQAKGAGGATASEARLERAPRVSGDRMSVSPGAVGWQAHLTDDKSARFLGVDLDLSRLTGPSASRQTSLLPSVTPSGPTTSQDATAGAPVLALEMGGALSTRLVAEALYDAGDGLKVGKLYHNSTFSNIGSSTWAAEIYNGDADTSYTNIRADFSGSSTAEYVTPTARRFVHFVLDSNSIVDTADGKAFAWRMANLAFYGDHGLTVRGAAPGGLLASDIIPYIIRRWAPLLTFTEGPSGTIQPSTFVIPQFAYPDATNAGELVRQATRFGLQDWAVWDDKTFYWHERGQRGRNWRARTGPAQLEETGPQLDRLWESVIVQYRDVDGSTRTVGPPGSGAGTEDAALKDLDPENPANKLGITRRAMLQAGTLLPAPAIELGRRFLEEQKLLDNSGRATITGHILDDRGILHPYWRMRAGDTLTLVDAADTSPRRIVRADHTTDSYSCTVDLDAPPDAMDALLERLAVRFVPLGVG